MRDGAVDLILLQKQLILPPRPALPGVRLQRFTLFISVYTPSRQSRFDPYLNKNFPALPTLLVFTTLPLYLTAFTCVYHPFAMLSNLWFEGEVCR
jgi:hypothetical protein